LPEVDVVVPLVVNSTAVLGAGRVRDRVLAVDGAPAVRPAMTLACSFDHKVWDGRRAATLLGEVRAILEGGDLEAEAGATM
jgi:pyruvate dehydrogenase E2 component (dihydrolipoamide acetyltransferase)